jgi:hypothetical protein
MKSRTARLVPSADPGPILVIAGATLIAILLLRWMGRPWWCACGRLFLWTGDIWSEHNSQHLFDYYSSSHILHGFLFWWFLQRVVPVSLDQWRLPAAVILEILWELAENSPFIIHRYREGTISLGYEGDSVLNSLSDIACAGVGFLIARRLGWSWGLAVFIVVEVAVVWLIRDNLTFNVLMLLFPLPAIKEWQMGGR